MNYFLDNFKRGDLKCLDRELERLYADYKVLNNIRTKFYPLFHYGNQVVFDNGLSADEFARVKKQYIQEYKKIVDYVFKDGVGVFEIIQMQENELNNYIDDYVKHIDSKFLEYEKENTRTLYYMILGDVFTNKQSSIFESYDIDIAKVTYANWINTETYFDLLFDLVKSKNDTVAIGGVFKKHLIDKKVADDFNEAFLKLHKKWQDRKRNQNDISAVTSQKFYEMHGTEMSIEFKGLLDDVLLSNDSEYQKMLKLYGDYKNEIVY